MFYDSYNGGEVILLSAYAVERLTLPFLLVYLWISTLHYNGLDQANIHHRRIAVFGCPSFSCETSAAIILNRCILVFIEHLRHSEWSNRAFRGRGGIQIRKNNNVAVFVLDKKTIYGIDIIVPAEFFFHTSNELRSRKNK